MAGDQRMKSKLNVEEKEILNAFENGALKPLRNSGVLLRVLKPRQKKLYKKIKVFVLKYPSKISLNFK